MVNFFSNWDVIYAKEIFFNRRIYNFRELDIIIGGQGAPLVPYGEKHLFSKYDYCINIGGILNLTDLNETKFLAFDVCPANLVLNFLARKLN